MKDNFKNTKAFFSKPLSEPIDDIEFMMVLRELEKAEKLDKREKASKWGRDEEAKWDAKMKSFIWQK